MRRRRGAAHAGGSSSYGWVVLLLATLVQASVSMLQQAPAALGSVLADDLGIGRAQLELLSAALLGGMAMTTLFMGILFVPVPDAGVPRDTVFAARDRVRQNRKTSAAGGRFWELSGGIGFSAERRMRLQQDRRQRSKDSPYYHYYRCQTRRKHGNEGCPNGKSYPAEKLEGIVWNLVSSLMSDPEQLRRDLERMVERERGAVRGDPEREARAWLDKPSEADRKRSGFQDMAAEGLLTLDELRTKLAVLEETRETAQRELEILDRRRERAEDLERDKEIVLEH
jgi:hypothetical protein